MHHLSHGVTRAKFCLLLLMLAAGFILVASPVAAQRPAGAQRVGVATVIDGDTIEMQGVRIRLDGVDAPERGRRCGRVNVYQRAAQALDSFVARRTVHCSIQGAPDRYGREIGRCSVAGADAGAFMVAQGWARDWPRYSGGAYAGAEAQARDQRRGIWGLSCPANLWGGRSYD